MEGIENLSNYAAAFGLAGLAANVAWIMMRRRSHLLTGQAIACGFMAVHFHLLGAATGALIMLVAGVQALLAVPLGLYPGFKLIYLLSGLMAPVICYFTWQGGSSLFSALVLLLVCIANYQLNEVRQRGLLIFALLAWIGHNMLVGSIPALMSNGVALVVSIKMLCRAIQLRTSPAGVW